MRIRGSHPERDGTRFGCNALELVRTVTQALVGFKCLQHAFHGLQCKYWRRRHAGRWGLIGLQGVEDFLKRRIQIMKYRGGPRVNVVYQSMSRSKGARTMSCDNPSASLRFEIATHAGQKTLRLCLPLVGRQTDPRALSLCWSATGE